MKPILTVRKTDSSILGDLSSLYFQPSSQNGRIHDKPHEGTLTLYPAGQTKRDTKTGLKRQAHAQYLYDAAIQLGKEDRDFPFHQNDYTVTLVRDLENQYDDSAIRVMFKGNPRSSLFKDKSFCLGYIPQRISAAICANMNLIRGVDILKVKNQVFGKYYMTKLVIYYGENANPYKSDSVVVDRFFSIMDE